MLWLAAAPLLIWVGLLLTPWQPWRCQQQLASISAEPLSAAIASQITVLIPARNEAACIGRTLTALRQQSSHMRVIVVDDQSQDETAAIARQHGAEVITGAPLAPGWTGKLWAMQQGLEKVTSPWLLQLDADIELASGMIEALWRQQQQGYDLVSIMAMLPTVSLWQRWLLPAYVWFFKLIYPFQLVAQSGRVAAAAGGCILLRRTLLCAIGGYQSLHDAVIDDCTLAARVKQAGGRCWLGLSHNVISHRDGSSLSDISHLVTRTAYTQLRHSLLWLLAASGLMVVAFWAAPLLVLSEQPGVRAMAVAALMAMVISYQPTLRFYRLSPLWGLMLPFTAALYLGMSWLSAWQHWRGGGAHWKGRVYRSH
ncbi:MAG: glycosyltransferase [Wenzhouxiangellaceae bacterium]